jgi:outer membrane protein TolC
VRDQAVVRLRENNVTVLTEQLKQTRDRFQCRRGDAHRVAQAEARRSSSIADLNVAQSNLKASRATYEQVGHPPSNLVTPPSIMHLLPSSLDEAMTLGDGENPVILGAVYQEEASLYAVNQIIGELLPQVSVEASYTQRLGFLNTPDIPGRDSLEAEDTTTVMAGERASLSGRRGRRPRAPGQGDQQPAEEAGGECAAQGPRRRRLQLGDSAIHRRRDQIR